MELTIIEMLAYVAAHTTDDLPWRCTACEHLTPHSDDLIERHLEKGHGYKPANIKRDSDGNIYLHPDEPGAIAK